MNSLPLSGSPQSSCNAASTLPAGSATDNPAAGAQAAQPFASLLAQQIGEVDPSTLEAVQTSLGDVIPADGNADNASKQDQAANSLPGPVDTLAALMLPPHDGRRQETEGKPHFAPDSSQTTIGGPARQPFASDSSQGAVQKNPMADSERMVRLQPLDHLQPEAVKPASISGLPETASNAAAPAAIPAAMPGMSANTLPPAAQQTITTPLDNHGWASEFTQKISWMSTQQNQVAELHLNPPNLGPLDVMLKISDNQATALFASPHGAVRDAVESALPKLREMLADNGIMLGNATISDQPPRDRHTKEFMNQGAAAQYAVPGIAAGLPSTAGQAMVARRHDGMVDTFA